MRAAPAEVMNRREMDRALTRIAHEILERNKGGQDLALVGIRTRGVHLAERIVQKIGLIEGEKVPLGVMDITFYRDDLGLGGHQHKVGRTEIPFSITDKLVVLVDDVLYTGRSIRAALDGLIDLGRPRAIQLAVLIDRGHRELPIRPDFVGKNVPTAVGDSVQVLLSEVDGEERVVILREGTA